MYCCVITIFSFPRWPFSFFPNSSSSSERLTGRWLPRRPLLPCRHRPKCTSFICRRCQTYLQTLIDLTWSDLGCLSSLIRIYSLWRRLSFALCLWPVRLTSVWLRLWATSGTPSSFFFGLFFWRGFCRRDAFVCCAGFLLSFLRRCRVVINRGCISTAHVCY